MGWASDLTFANAVLIYDDPRAPYGTSTPSLR
jgi:hypothetical protein